MRARARALPDAKTPSYTEARGPEDAADPQGDQVDCELASAIASLASAAAAFTSQAQRVAELLAGRAGSSSVALALLAQPEAVMTGETKTVDTAPIKLTLTPAEAAELLGVSPRTLARMRAACEGPKPLRVRGAVRYRWRDVERWLEGRRA